MCAASWPVTSVVDKEWDTEVVVEGVAKASHAESSGPLLPSAGRAQRVTLSDLASASSPTLGVSTRRDTASRLGALAEARGHTATRPVCGASGASEPVLTSVPNCSAGSVLRIGSAHHMVHQFQGLFGAAEQIYVVKVFFRCEHRFPTSAEVSVARVGAVPRWPRTASEHLALRPPRRGSGREWCMTPSCCESATTVGPIGLLFVTCGYVVCRVVVVAEIDGQVRSRRSVLLRRSIVAWCCSQHAFEPSGVDTGRGGERASREPLGTLPF